MGIGDWGLGIWAQSPIPNPLIPQSPNPHKLNNCSINLNINDIDAKSCSYTKANDYFYLSYMCLDKTIQIYQFSLGRQTAAYIVAGIDVASIIVLLICVIVIAVDEKKAERLFHERHKLISQYTIEVSNLEISRENANEEIRNLLDHFENVLKIETNDFNQDRIKDKKRHLFYEINYPFINDEILNNLISLKKLNTLLNDKKNTIQSEKSNNKNLEKEIFQIEKQIKELNINITKLSGENFADKIKEIFFTFHYLKDAMKIHSVYSRNKCTRCCYIFWCNKRKINHLYYKNNWLNLTISPDEPSNIKWENMNYSSCKRFLRKTMVAFITFLLILASFGVIIGGKYFQENLDQQFDNNIDCDFVTYDVQSVYTEYILNMPSRNRVKTYCFCKNLLNTQGFSNTINYVLSYENRPTFTPCNDWVNSYIKYQAFTWAIILAVPIMNALIRLVITLLTQCEKNKSLRDDKVSNMLKIVVSTVINTAISILIINTYIQSVKQWNKDFPVFTGLYPDFNPAWFNNVGTTIAFSMVISIVEPHIWRIIDFLFNWCRRCCDSGNMIGRNSKKQTKKSFMELYTGPEFLVDNQYANVIQIFIFLDFV